MMLRRFHTPVLGDERGFTLAVTMGIMLIASIICVAAFQAAGGDLVPSRENSDRRVAYTAAESGLAWYQTKLNSNPDYWQKCDTGVTGSVADPVNQPGVALASRKWKVVSGTGKGTADFSLAVLTQSPYTSCSTTDFGSTISDADGSFQVRSTGRYHGKLRTIVAKFRRTRFLDYVYFTDFEVLDPSLRGDPGGCRNYRAARPSGCTNITFGGGDRINGPLHTNDDILTCGTVTFGRDSDDTLEVHGPAPGFTPCDATQPTFNGPFTTNADYVDLPPSNSQLKTLTTACCSGTNGYLFTGTQYIRFIGGGKMVVDTPAGTPTTYNVPPNGVIYVQQDTTAGCVSQSPNGTAYTDTAGCANVYVSGTSDKSVTIASAGDIIVAPTQTTDGFNPMTATGSDADLKSGTLDTGPPYKVGGDVQIGLIADGFVRVYHRVDTGGTLQSAVRNVRIDAAILSLQHSFIVDNWDRGGYVGVLNVNGIIAQRFRGTVGTGGGTITNGYQKNYWYDDRLHYKSPPYFLDPVNAGWNLFRQNELVPAK